jgi:hypothetical protein
MCSIDSLPHLSAKTGHQQTLHKVHKNKQFSFYSCIKRDDGPFGPKHVAYFKQGKFSNNLEFYCTLFLRQIAKDKAGTDDVHRCQLNKDVTVRHTELWQYLRSDQYT